MHHPHHACLRCGRERVEAVWVVGAFPCCSKLEGVRKGSKGDAERIAGILLFVNGRQRLLGMDGWVWVRG